MFKKPTLAAAALAAALFAVVSAPTSASAAGTASSKVVVNCWGGRCAVYFSKAATRDFAQGMLPSPSTSPVILAANAAILGHRIIAQQYANRGWCSAFLISPYPWENKGYTGYPCSWE